MTIDLDKLSCIKINPLLDTLALKDISDDIYFSVKYKNYISNSRLGILKSKGVKAFFEGFKQEYSPSFAFGTMLHQLVLQPEDYELINSVFKPTAKAGVMADNLYKDDGNIPTDDEIRAASLKYDYYKNSFTNHRLVEFKNKAIPYWRDRFLFEQKNGKGEVERIYTDEKSVMTLQNCLESIALNKNIQNLLHPETVIEEPYTANEKTILLDVEVNSPYGNKVYHLKAKLDNFTIQDDIITVNDVKTTSKPANEFNPKFFSYQRELSK